MYVYVYAETVWAHTKVHTHICRIKPVTRITGSELRSIMAPSSELKPVISPVLVRRVSMRGREISGPAALKVHRALRIYLRKPISTLRRAPYICVCMSVYENMNEYRQVMYRTMKIKQNDLQMGLEKLRRGSGNTLLFWNVVCNEIRMKEEKKWIYIWNTHRNL